MKIKILWVGKTKSSYIKHLVNLYAGRLEHYAKLECIEIAGYDKRKMSPEQLKQVEAELLLKRTAPGDYVILLDERGKFYSSKQLAEFLQGKKNESLKQMTFIIGGAFGSHESLFERADLTLSLSPMTFTHDMTRIILLEQIYRVYTIMKGEKYHNE